jgi:hypothetical protein
MTIIIIIIIIIILNIHTHTAKMWPVIFIYFFMIYLMTLSIDWIADHQMVGWLGNNKWENIFREASMM